MAGGALFLAVACVLLAGAISVSSSSRHVFPVGGKARGWKQPTANEETYNHWASRNRFHVGNFLYFKYAKNDSVLLVTRDDYKLCSADKPTIRFDGGETRFLLERSGFLYFISAAPGHCDAGQRMTVRVMAQHGEDDGAAPAESPSMSPGGSGSTPGSGEGSGSGSVPPPPAPPKKAGDGKTSGASSSMHASFGAAYHAAGVVLGAAMLVLA